MSFTVLHQRALRSRCISLSSTMDLIASVDFDGTLTVLRTFLWEKIFSMARSELVDSDPCCLEFSPCGFVVAMGSDNGEVALIDTETQKIVRCRNNSIGQEVLTMRWLTIQETPIKIPDLVSLSGVPPIASEEDDAPTYDQPDILCRLKNTLLLVQTREGSISGYTSGQYLLFVVKTPTPSLLLLPRYYNTNNATVCYLNQSTPASSQKVVLSDAITKLSVYSVTQRLAYLLINIQQDFLVIENSVKSCGRKWKDALRTVGPKLSLAHSTIVSYELDFTVSQFFYTLALCQHWHPAAQTIFSTQWNEQNLTRLKQGIDIASFDIITTLQTNVLTALTTSLLRSRECYELLCSHPEMQWGISPEQLLACTAEQEQLLCKLDSAIVEAKRARSSMLLFMQFLRVNMVLAKDAATPIPTGVDTTPSTAYLSLFEPLTSRAPELQPLQSNPSIPLSKLQAESVTGSHLYAYLEEAPIPDCVLKPPIDEKNKLKLQLKEWVCGRDANKSMSLLSHVKKIYDQLYPNLCSTIDSFECAATTSMQPAQNIASIPNINIQVDGEQQVVFGLISTSVKDDAIEVILSSSEMQYGAKIGIADMDVLNVQFYCHFPENTSQHRFALVGVTTSRQLFKIDLTEVQYVVMTDATTLPVQHVEIQSRVLKLRSLGGMYVSGSRGVVCVMDETSSQIVVVDMEENEDESDEDDEEEGNDMSAASDDKDDER